MLILTIRTDKPISELGLYEDGTQLVYEKWQAHRKLASTINIKIKQLLDSQNKTLQDLEGIACFKGPGSFTGLRIGLTVANTLSDSLQIPIYSSGAKNWIDISLTTLLNGENQKIAIAKYGSPAFTTKPKGN